MKIHTESAKTAPRQKLAKAQSKKGATVAGKSGATMLKGEGNHVTALFDRIADILERARARVVRAVNSEMVLAYWHIGREIVEQLQDGRHRAGYGDSLVEELSQRLAGRFGRGYSTTNLRYFRAFYLAYQDRKPEIRHIRSGELPAASPSPDHRAENTRKHHIRGGVSADLEDTISNTLYGEELIRRLFEDLTPFEVAHCRR